MKKMSKTCEIVQDLLPLYIDNVCSKSSQEMIREHLPDCPDCNSMLHLLKSSQIEQELTEEKTEVIDHQRKLFRRKTSLAGAIIAGIFMIPILVCLIVNLTTGATLDWFFIVLCALLLAGSVTVVPLMAPDRKGLWTLGLSTAALILLLGVCCIYTHGNWFFVAASSTLFGLSVSFLPYVVNNRWLRHRLNKYRGLICMTADTVLYAVMMICIGLRTDAAEYGRIALSVSLPIAGMIWLLFLIFRYLPFRRLTKTGISCMLIGAFVFALEPIINNILGFAYRWPAFSPGAWNPATIDGNITWLCLIVGIVLGVILIIVGFFKGGKKK